MGTGNYSGTSNSMKLVHWPLMGGLLHLVQRWGDWAGPQPAQAPPRCTKCNSPPINGQCIPIIVLLCNDPLLCGFNLPIKGLSRRRKTEAVCLFICSSVRLSPETLPPRSCRHHRCPIHFRPVENKTPSWNLCLRRGLTCSVRKRVPH